MNTSNIINNNLSFFTELPTPSVPSDKAFQIIKTIKPNLKSVNFLRENKSTIREFQTVKEMLKEEQDHSVRTEILPRPRT